MGKYLIKRSKDDQLTAIRSTRTDAQKLTAYLNEVDEANEYYYICEDDSEWSV